MGPREGGPGHDSGRQELRGRFRRRLPSKPAWAVAATLGGDPKSISSHDLFPGLQTQRLGSAGRLKPLCALRVPDGPRCFLYALYTRAIYDVC